jgi:hypothetical protein
MFHRTHFHFAFSLFVEHFNSMKRWLSVCFGLLSFVALLSPQRSAAALARFVVLENNVGYLHIAGTDKDLADGIPAALNHLEATNSIAGIVVDLRFAGGKDTDDLPAIERVLEQSKLPLAILINGQTAGASAKLAEDLREENTGLVFGSAADNFQPDISVRANADDEKNFLKDPYADLPQTISSADSSTNLLPFVDIDHTTEADLVREKIKDGDQNDTTDHPSGPQMPFIHDPVLARGVDFIKGVAALRLTSNQP